MNAVAGYRANAFCNPIVVNNNRSIFNKKGIIAENKVSAGDNYTNYKYEKEYFADDPLLSDEAKETMMA